MATREAIEFSGFVMLWYSNVCLVGGFGKIMAKSPYEYSGK
jgi:hypothetical protein